MYNKKMIAMMLTLSMLAASLAGCAGDDDDDDVFLPQRLKRHKVSSIKSEQ